MVPFTPAQFLQTLVAYNLAIGPLHWVLTGLAIACVALVLHGGAAAGRWVAAVLAVFWAWMALAYHLAFFTAINPAAWIFAAAFLAAAGLFAWRGAIRGGLKFAGGANTRCARAGAALVVLALVAYPAASWMLGHRYPASPTFGLPCPTTVFTLGVLLMASRPRPLVLFVVPLLWTVVGGTAAIFLGMREDLVLPLAGLTVAALQSRHLLTGVTAPAG